MSYHIIDSNESYSKAHDGMIKYLIFMHNFIIYLDLLKNYFAEKTDFTIKGKMSFLKKALVNIFKQIYIINKICLKNVYKQKAPK